ncbi:SAM-dependent methyltransferase [Streptomyces sp. NPDC058086]|uniref:SAM-dependent methyltransferase n=1 Tax=Streptomyces sp. NPDC058086 TaxID=3346334 RepID=UPI0036E22AF5
MLDVDRKSYWGDYYSYFPALARYIPLGEYARRVQPRACVLGVSDGKFALPLLRAGWQVVGVESDDLFLNGGELDLVDGHHDVVGLRQRLAAEGLEDRCTVVEQDYMTLPAEGDFQLVLGSGLWSMPPNRAHTMEALVHHAMDMVAPGGLFFGEYLIGLNDDERQCGYYPTATEMERIVTRPGWELFENADLGIRGESHLGYEQWHYHRYAAAIAHRMPPPREPVREK